MSSDYDKESGGNRPYEDPKKDEITRNESLHDHDVLGKTNVTKEDAMHMGILTEEELVAQKKLLKIIDSLIMPLVMLVRCPAHPRFVPTFR